MSAKPSKTMPRRLCGASEAHCRLCEEYPEFRVNRGKIHAETEIVIRRGVAARRVSKQKPVTIQVVVHVVYSTPAENISDQQVASQIAALNRDFGATNSDKSRTPAPWKGLIGDSGIRFALATKDPSGAATTGITRTATKVKSFSTNDKVKRKTAGGMNAWPAGKYLNIWVCTLGGGLLGYAQFPGGPRKFFSVKVSD